MAVDLLNVIRDDSAVRSGGFTGAIFLTYSLNLTFFEQLLAPALDQAGCSNVLIITDPDGYQQALEMGGKAIQAAGLRYVCTPLLRKGIGIQHAKMLLMAGPNQGRLLIGSGNLTFHGFGRNLEIYSRFDYDAGNTSTQIDPFLEAWQLIQNIIDQDQLPFAAQQQITAISENVSWLRTTINTSESNVWNNYERPLLQQLITWRKTHGFVDPVRKLRAIAPYYDQNLSALKYLADHLEPVQFQIHLDPSLTNLDGKSASQQWQGRSPKLNALAIGPGKDQNPQRHVHAKAIIGQEKNGSWCIAGSANLSRPALLSSWQTGGNLELVTFHWSDDKNAFNYLLEDPMIQTWEIDLSSIAVTESEPSERSGIRNAEIFLVDLNLQGEKIEGKLSSPLPKGISDPQLHLQRKNLNVPVRFQDGTSFIAPYQGTLEESEIARLEGTGFCTPYRWIDQPAVLARYGARTYQVRIKGKLETLLGAEQLFQELMNFLWERVDLDAQSKDELDLPLSRSTFGRKKSGDETKDPLPPGPEAFIITEKDLVNSIHGRLDFHHPYDRSLISLRDLFSLVLLRLTAPTQQGGANNSDEPSDEDEQQIEQEELKINILQRLSNFLIHYCNRYANRLVDRGFIQNTPPEVIFQNHYTLGRILIEFSSKASEVFTDKEFLNCFWLIWAPLVKPIIVGRRGSPTLKAMLEEYGQKRTQEAWHALNMANLAKVMLIEALGQPPSWKAVISTSKKVAHFVVASKWIREIKQMLGNNVFLELSESYQDLYEASIDSSHFRGRWDKESFLAEIGSTFPKIEDYCVPIEEKYKLLFDLEKTFSVKPEKRSQLDKLIEEIETQGLGAECKSYLSNPKPIKAILKDGGMYCSRCGAEIPMRSQAELIRGQLVLCVNTRDAWLYLKPHFSETLFPQ